MSITPTATGALCFIQAHAIPKSLVICYAPRKRFSVSLSGNLKKQFLESAW